MIVIQGVVNVLGLLSGSLLIGQGHFVIAFFMSISAGTFLYISLAEVLLEQIHNMNKKKFFTILAANSLIILIVFLEKFSEQLSEKE
jgi:zinc transporter ZupT